MLRELRMAMDRQSAKMPPLKERSRNCVLAVLSGLLAFGAFPPLDISLLAWVSFVPLFFVIRNRSKKEAFWYSYLAGVVFFGSLLYWLLNVTVPGTIILVLFLGLFYGIFGTLAGMVLKYSMNLFLVSFIWVILEYIRAHLFTGFPWGMLGHSQYLNINLIQIADLMGAYGVSFIVMTFNAAVFSFASRSKKKISYMMFALLFVITVTSYGIYRIDNFRYGGTSRISVIQGNIPQSMKWERDMAGKIMDVYASLSARAAAEGPDMIVWPETAYPYLAGKGRELAPDISDISSELDTPLLAGLVYEEDGAYYNTAVLFGGGDRDAVIYKKLHLVPFGEYVPFERYLGRFRDHIDKPIGDFRRGDEYTLFTLRSLREFTDHDGSRKRFTAFHEFGALICFEDVFPYLSRRYAREGARLLVNMTNDAWFGDTAAARQHLQSSVFRAVENRVPVVRAANTGVSCFIDPTGRIVSEVNVDGRGTFVRGYDTYDIKMSEERAPYTFHGDTFVYFSAFMLVMLLFLEGVSARARGQAALKRR